MSAADKRIAELEQEVQQLRQELTGLRATVKQRDILNTRDLEHIERLQAQLVQRDVYEAEQRLPPEQAALIKHLETVEKCIDHGPVNYYHAEESDCSFCGEWQGHKRDCAWLLLQLDRGVTKVMDELEDAARLEHARRDRLTMTAGRAAMIQGLAAFLRDTPWRREYLGEFPTRDTVTFAPQRATVPTHEVHSASGQQGQPGGEGRREEHHEGDPSLPHRPDDEQR